MGAEASLNAIEMAGIDKNSIDMIVCATTSGRYALPSTACEVQRILELDNIPAFDVAAACAGILLRTQCRGSVCKIRHGKTCSW